MYRRQVKSYLVDIERELGSGRATEHTYRPALKRFVESLRAGIAAVNEPKRVACGAPDFIVADGAVTVGYIEAKDIGSDLDAIERTEQLERYLDALPNLILTDYLEFRLYQSGELATKARLGRLASPGQELVLDQTGAQRFDELCELFLGASFPVLATPRDLAQRMAGTARILRYVIGKAFEAEQPEESLHKQFEAFRRVLLHDLEPAQFADMYAQTICYGLFAARCNHKPGNGVFKRQAAVYELPETNPFLRQMFDYIAGPQLDTRLSWAVDHLVQLLDRADMSAILRDFGKRTRQEDPVVHFYETFLAAYDPSLRETRGVYYTPEPVVSYIVRSVDKILQRDFGIGEGLAATDKVPVYENHMTRRGGTTKRKTGEVHKVLILDPAVGTGTFLHGVVDSIHNTISRTHGAGAWNGYVPAHLLPRLFGFELLMAPYAVAHMKLGIQLAETGYEFHSGERLRVYLTNTLEEAFELGDLPLFANIIAEEANAAGQVKTNHPVMVILGNPPYSGHSVNNSRWIADLLRGTDSTANATTASYFEVDGEPLGERNPKWLNDDYVKFIRFAQWRIERTGYGVLAFISNHGYLDNPTFRGMRQSLMDTFDDIYVLDLHGNAKKKETAPDGSKDQNVFDIQQGVAIGIFVKRKNGNTRAARVRHADLWGVREVWDKGKLVGGKYAALNTSDIDSTDWAKVKPRSPFYLFVPEDGQRRGEYEKGWSIPEMMPANSIGIITARDRLTIGWTEDDMWDTVRRFARLKPEEARDQFELGPDVEDWKVNLAQEDVRDSGPEKRYVAGIQYRPFDRRWTYYTGKSRGFICRPRPEIMRHMLGKDNLALSTARSIEIGRGWEHIFCSRYMIESHAVSLKEVNYLFPLYLYPKETGDIDDLEDVAVREEADRYGIRRKPNLDPVFIEELSRRVKLAFVADGAGDLKKTFGPEDVFHYTYAVLHSPMYRSRYAAFLKRDFPRIPLTSRRPLFRRLCRLGARLTALHILEAGGKKVATFPVSGDNVVERPRYVDTQQRVYINDTQYFEKVPGDVWSFYVGGYQVCHKWIKDRRGRKLSYDEVHTYGRIVSVLDETVRIMSRIDKAIEAHGNWPMT